VILISSPNASGNVTQKLKGCQPILLFEHRLAERISKTAPVTDLDAALLFRKTSSFSNTSLLIHTRLTPHEFACLEEAPHEPDDLNICIEIRWQFLACALLASLPCQPVLRHQDSLAAFQLLGDMPTASEFLKFLGIINSTCFDPPQKISKNFFCTLSSSSGTNSKNPTAKF
jgi:hypothetical protein